MTLILWDSNRQEKEREKSCTIKQTGKKSSAAARTTIIIEKQRLPFNFNGYVKIQASLRHNDDGGDDDDD